MLSAEELDSYIRFARSYKEAQSESSVDSVDSVYEDDATNSTLTNSSLGFGGHAAFDPSIGCMDVHSWRIPLGQWWIVWDSHCLGNVGWDRIYGKHWQILGTRCGPGVAVYLIHDDVSPSASLCGNLTNGRTRCGIGVRLEVQ